MTSFEHISSHPIPDLRAQLEQYLDPASGARHVHLASDQDEFAFLVGFPTVPQASDGRAHILEHLALCGSERFPVADPFFAMLRRSTATFMNAMTYPDRTVYPFASTDRTDFFNLLDVYLDATFFPKLDYLSFRQEGWRHSFKDDRLVRQGVVLNEMKGAFGDPLSILYSGLNKALFPGTSYAENYGGDPLVIPELSHEMLLEFHASHYHPSQAMFMSAGRIEAKEIQAKLVERVLSRRTGRCPARRPELAADWIAPRRAQVRVPSAQARPDEHGLQLSWRFGESTDPLATARLRLLSHGLLGDASAPVMKAMQSAGFGRPSQMNFVDSGLRQHVLHIGMEGLTETQVERAKSCIEHALEDAATDGVPVDVLKTALRDMRFAKREIQGDTIPDALRRLLDAVPLLMNGGDVATAFDIEPVLQQLEKEIEDPAFFKRAVRELINHPNLLATHVIADADFATLREAQEAKALALKERELSDDERRQIGAEEAALAEHRKARSNIDVLPCVQPSELRREPIALPEIQHQHSSISVVGGATNGITYATTLFDLSTAPKDDWPWLSLYADIVPDLGTGSLGFEEADRWRQRQVSSFSMTLDTLVEAGRTSLTPQLNVHASALTEDEAGIPSAIAAWTLVPRFDELDRISFLTKARVARKVNGLAAAAGQYASLAAAAPYSIRRQFAHRVHGLASLPFVAALGKMLESPEGVQAIADHLKRIHQLLLEVPNRVIWVGLNGSSLEASKALDLRPSRAGRLGASDAISRAHEVANVALRVASQVNHCHIAWAAPSVEHPDAAPLAVAAELLTHLALHRKLREEGGAYGGWASYSAEDGLFTMSSFRDPRLAGTYADFAGSVREIQDACFSQQTLEEAIISVIKRLDKPLAPYTLASAADRSERRGVTKEMRRAFRQQVLACTLMQVKEALARWLPPQAASRAAAVGNANQDLCGMAVIEVADLVN
ncbi:insulinase family protein [Paraburkholderia sp. EG285A]|uniref:insulinase family protein n=1 Tax=Paraburkholderia sp. EG285A TaxID=3237009 RepID=UPI0034D22CC4